MRTIDCAHFEAWKIKFDPENQGRIAFQCENFVWTDRGVTFDVFSKKREKNFSKKDFSRPNFMRGIALSKCENAFLPLIQGKEFVFEPKTAIFDV